MRARRGARAPDDARRRPPRRVVFADEIHYRAEYLRAVAERPGRRVLVLSTAFPRKRAPPGHLRQPEHERLTAAVLMTLAADAVLEPTLFALPAACVADPARALGIDMPSPIDRVTDGSPSTVVRALMARVHSRQFPGIPLAEPAVNEQAPAVDQRRTPARSEARLSAGEVEATYREPDIQTRFGGLFYLRRQWTVGGEYCGAPVCRSPSCCTGAARSWEPSRRRSGTRLWRRRRARQSPE